MADLTRRGEAAQRAADVLLRAAGGRAVALRMAVPPVPGAAGEDVREQVGLGVPAFADVERAPVVMRRARPDVERATGAMRWELLVSATAVARVAGTRDAGVAFAMFAGAAGVVVGGAVLEIMGASSSDLTGSPYVYRLRLQTASGRLR